MSASPPSGPPYLHWALDRWKLIVLSVLFVVLLLSVLVWMQQAPPSETGTAAATPAPATGQPALAVPTPTPQVELALTFANVAPNMVANVSAVSALSGTAAADSQVEVRHIGLLEDAAAGLPLVLDQAQSLGTAVVGADGLWRLELNEPLAAGQHLLMAQQVDAGGAIVAETPILVLTLVEAAGELPSAGLLIDEPAVGQRLTSGARLFRGRGLAGSRVQLFVNDRFLGDGVVAADSGWQVEPSSPLPSGSYVGRAALLNPFGRITAESAATAFVIEGVVDGAALPPIEQAPLVPLQVTGWPPQGTAAEGCTGRLVGVATPASSIIVLAANQPLVAGNVQRDTGWQLNLPPGLMVDCSALVVASNLGEAVALAPFYPVVAQPVDPVAYQPVFVTPQNGQVLSTRRPLLRGVARPVSVVSLVVNDQLVATVQADPTGQWAYQVQSDLTGDEAVLEAYVAAEDGSVLAATPPVVVTFENGE